MPSLNETIGQDLSGYEPVKASPQHSLPPIQGTEPTLNPMLRCPLPPIFQSTPDSLRQFYQGGKVPQTRLLSAATNGISGGSGDGGSGGNAVIEIVTNSGSVPAPLPSTAEQAVVTTAILAPMQQFTGTLNNITKSFQLLNVATNVPARVTLYGTSNAQTGDLYRGLDVPPPAGSTQGIITDVVLDTLPYQWVFQNRVGANGDVPQKSEVYITVTNLSSAATAVIVTLQYTGNEQ